MTPVQICNIALSLIGAGSISSLSDSTPQAEECNKFYELDRDIVLADHDWDFARKRLALTSVREVKFDAGQTAAPAVGATITQDTDTYGTVVYVDLQSGTWAGNDAAGVIIISGHEGTFEDNETITWSGGQATINEPNGYGTSDYDDWGYSYLYPSDCLAARRILNVASEDMTKFEIAMDQSLNKKLILTAYDDAVLVYTAALTDTDLFDNAFIFALACKIAASISHALRGDLNLDKSKMEFYMYSLGLANKKDSNESKQGKNESNPYIEARG